MIKALSLAAALALLPVSAAVAQEARGSAEQQLEAAGEAFEARMEEFGERSEAIAGDTRLSAGQREVTIASLWAEYQPAIEAFTAKATEMAPKIAQQALAGIDVEAVVAEAMTAVQESGALQVASGMAANGSWASNDPEHMATMGLVVDYALGEAADSLSEDEAGQDHTHEDEAPASRTRPNRAD